MTFDFCYEIQLNPGTTADTVSVDLKLDNFMLRGAMRIFKLSGGLSQSI